MEVLRRWEHARKLGLFAAEEKEQLRKGGVEHTLLINEEGAYELVPYFQIKGAFSGAADLWAYAFERYGKSYALVWHNSGSAKVHIPLSGAKYERDLGKEVLPIENAEDGIALTVEASAYLSAEISLDAMVEAIQKANYTPKKDITIALDCAASEYYRNGMYDYSLFEGPNGKRRFPREQVDYLEELINKYPIDSIEDGMAENDWEGWRKLTKRIGERCQLVGDDLFVTNVKFLQKGIDEQCANSILIKVNQIGTLSESLDAIALAQRNGYRTIISHRSGETEDTTIADLAVATNSGQIKTGSLSRSDRLAKYNQLLRIEEELGERACYGKLKEP